MSTPCTNLSASRKLYGRRKGRALPGARASALEAGLSSFGVAPDFLNESGSNSPDALFGKNVPHCWLEIGFGSGEHLAALLRRSSPDTFFIGAEPFVNGVSNLMKDIGAETLLHPRIRILMDDALLLVRALKPECLDGIYVLNPDPWPKKRHHKRRIISQVNLGHFARVLKPGAQLIMSTDVDALAEWMVTQASLHPAFEWTACCESDWNEPPADWIATRYEQKGVEAGRKQRYLVFRKR